MGKVWVGVDAGKGFHWAVALGAEGEILLSRRVENDEEDLSALIAEALSFGLDEVLWATDQPGGSAALLCWRSCGSGARGCSTCPASPSTGPAMPTVANPRPTLATPGSSPSWPGCAGIWPLWSPATSCLPNSNCSSPTGATSCSTKLGPS